MVLFEKVILLLMSLIVVVLLYIDLIFEDIYILVSLCLIYPSFCMYNSKMVAIIIIIIVII